MQITAKSMQEAKSAKHRSFTDMRGLRPPPAPRITCNCGKTWAERMAAGTGSGDRVGETPPTAGDDSFESWRTRRAEERGRLVRHFRHQSLRLRERRKIRWKRAVRSAAGRRSSPRSSSCFLPDLCAGEYSRRAACDSEGEECLRSAEQDGNVPAHTCAYLRSPDQIRTTSTHPL